MNELDEVWARLTNEALEKARVAGRGDVAEYFELKANNDQIRAASVKWLFEAILEIASFANQTGAGVEIEDEAEHQFSFRNANLSGSRIRLRQGVRCLSVEAGWTRTTTDGFMRGGAFAVARISHFGISRHNAELLLLKTNDSLSWFSIDPDGKRSLFDSRHLNQHFQIFLGRQQI